jgi:chromosome segregation ATPase
MNENNTRNFRKHVNIDNNKDTQTYAFYSRVLNKPFDSVNELKAAEAAHYAEIKVKEEQAAAKKADAKKVEDAFKALNAARRTYKEKLTTLTADYGEALKKLRAGIESEKAACHAELANAESAYQVALKEFNAAHPEGFHVTLRDGDFETTIESRSSTSKPTSMATGLFDIFDLFFNI